MEDDQVLTVSKVDVVMERDHPTAQAVSHKRASMSCRMLRK